MKKSCHLLSGTGVIALMCFATTPAFAQAVQAAPVLDGGREIVIVTARKTAENIQSIPVSVTAITADTIAKLNIQGLNDVARFTPGFSFENYSGAFSSPVIRGQTQTRIDLAVQNTASFFNGVYLQRNYMVDASLLEVERIEVIKGPQSALYGRNAFSGAINYITARPGNTFKANATLTVGSDERFDFKTSVTLPIVEDKFSVLAAFGSSRFDGTWKNAHPLAAQGGRRGTQNNLAGYDKSGYLLSIFAKPVEQLTFDIAYTHSDIHVEHAASYAVSTASNTGASVNGLTCSPLPGLPGPPGPPNIFNNNQNRLYCGAFPALPVIQPGETRLAGLLIDPRAFGQDGDTSVLSAKATWDITGDLVLGYQYGEAIGNVEARGAPTRDILLGRTSAGQTFGLISTDSQPNGGIEAKSHELRLEWTPGGIIRRGLLGVYYSETVDNSRPVQEFLQPNTLNAPVAFSSALGNTTREDEVTGYFGLVTLDITSSISFTGELRYTEENLTLLNRAAPPATICALPLPFAICPAAVAAFNLSSTKPNGSEPLLRPAQPGTFDYWTPRVALDYQWTEDRLLYVSIGKGVKSGGFNTPGLDPEQDVYNPEENWTYEIGSKNLLFDKKLRLNASFFYIDWKGIQGTVSRNYPASGRVLNVTCFAACSVPALGGNAGSIIGNLGEATVLGVELDGSWFATHALRFDYAFSYVQPEYADGQFSKRIATSQNCNGIVCGTSTFDSAGRPVTGPNIGGNTLERTPKLKVSVGAQYDWRMEGLDVDWSLRGDVTYQDKQYVDELNLGWVPERTLLDASLSASWDKVTARIWVKNLTDEEYVASSFFLVGLAAGGNRGAAYVPFLGEKRTMGVTLSFRH